jgi:Icc-related predicted phosphoesterase
MKVQVMSDLHLEFHGNSPYLPYINPEIDLLLLAGDITTSPYSYNLFLKEVRKKTSAPIVAVLGNHEFYGNNIKTALKEYLAGCQLVKDFYILENSHIDFANVRVIGATLWTSFDNGNEVLAALQGMSDFHVIEFNKDSNPYDLAQEMMKRHKKSVSYIRTILQKSNNYQTIVLTHHGVSYQSVHEKYRTSRLNHAFVSNLENMILQESPTICLHGHVHNHFDYEIGNTRVIANPLGYRTEYDSTGYVEGMTIEL